MITVGFFTTFLLLLAMVLGIDYFLYGQNFYESFKIIYQTEFVLGVDKLLLYLLIGLIFALVDDYRRRKHASKNRGG